MLLFSNEVPTVRIAVSSDILKEHTVSETASVSALKRKGAGGTAYSVGTVSRSCPLIEACYI
jgi:hypothetical protein